MPEEIIVRGAVLPITEKARDQFNQGQVDLIVASVVPPGTPLATVHRFLELSARYGLDPFTGELWCALMSGKDGANGRVAILVGRDGYLKVARRDPAFIDVDSDVVYSKDEFKVARKADGTRTVEHSYGNPSTRGEALGAYAVLRREGKPDRYFYAPLAQYAKDAEKSAWRYRDAQIVKCATSYITRTTYGVSGPTPADEINGGLALPAEGLASVAVDGTAAESDALPEAIVALLGRARAVDPLAFRENELIARLPERTADTYVPVVDGIVAELQAWLAEHEPEEAVVVEPRSFEDVEAHSEPTAQESPQDRYDRDEEWRGTVDTLLGRRMDLEAAGDDAQTEQAVADIAAEIDHLDQELGRIGVPDGWMPGPVGQASLGV